MNTFVKEHLKPIIIQSNESTSYLRVLCKMIFEEESYIYIYI